MTAEELISASIPPLKSTDTAEKALNWMDEFKLTQLPVLENRIYRGIITDEIILEKNNIQAPISSFELKAANVYVHPFNHFYDIIRIASENRLEIIPVLDDQKIYGGVISMKDISNQFGNTFAIQTAGSVLVLSIRYIDYSLTEISRLVEENNAKIVSMHIETDETDSEKIKVTIKINKTDLRTIVATLERYNYHILARFEEELSVSDNKERLDLLLKYLDI